MLRSWKKRLCIQRLQFTRLSKHPVLHDCVGYCVGFPLLQRRSVSFPGATTASAKANAMPATTQEPKMTDRPPSVYFDIDNLEVSSSSSSSGDDESIDDKPSSGPTSYFRSFPRHRPLINFVRNEWQSKSSYRSRGDSSQASSSDRDVPRWIQVLTAIIFAPKFRRYLFVYVILLSIFWAGWKGILKPRIDEHVALVKSLDIESQDKVGGWFGTNARPPLADIVQTRSLDPSLLPSASNGRRLVIVGDVHGCKDECMLFSPCILQSATSFC
jgi:hypothetical protein